MKITLLCQDGAVNLFNKIAVLNPKSVLLLPHYQISHTRIFQQIFNSLLPEENQKQFSLIIKLNDFQLLHNVGLCIELFQMMQFSILLKKSSVVEKIAQEYHFLIQSPENQMEVNFVCVVHHQNEFDIKIYDSIRNLLSPFVDRDQFLICTLMDPPFYKPTKESIDFFCQYHYNTTDPIAEGLLMNVIHKETVRCFSSPWTNKNLRDHVAHFLKSHHLMSHPLFAFVESFIERDSCFSTNDRYHQIVSS